jgi:hypothetical protein
VPQGATASPASLPATGQPFSFRVTGLACGNEYSFAVVAMYAGGGVTSQSTPQMRPCVAPAPPAALSVTAAANHSLTLGWSAPTSTGGGTVSYDVSWSGASSGGQNGLTGTSFQITGLTNAATYSYTVAAVSSAGSSQPPASGSFTLTPPSHAYNTYRNTQFLLNVRQQPSEGSASVARIPVLTGSLGPQVTVFCQTTGSVVADPVDKTLTGDLWDKVSYQGVTGYISDLYVDTPQSQAGHYDSWSDPPLWQCQ